MLKYKDILKEMKYSYTTYKLDINSGKLSNRENLDDLDELNDFMYKIRNKFPSLLIIQDQNNKYKIMTHNGKDFEEIQNGKIKTSEKHPQNIKDLNIKL